MARSGRSGRPGPVAGGEHTLLELEASVVRAFKKLLFERADGLVSLEELQDIYESGHPCCIPKGGPSQRSHVRVGLKALADFVRKGHPAPSALEQRLLREIAKYIESRTSRPHGPGRVTPEPPLDVRPEVWCRLQGMPAYLCVAANLLVVSSRDEGVFLVPAEASSETHTGTRLLSRKVGISRLAVSPDGALLAVSREDGSVSLFDLAGRRDEVVRLEGHGLEVNGLTFSGDKTLATTARDGVLRLRSTDSAVESLVIPIAPYPTCVAASSEEGCLVVASATGMVWRRSSESRRLRTGRSERSFARCIAASSDARKIVLGHDNGAVELLDSELRPIARYQMAAPIDWVGFAGRGGQALALTGRGLWLCDGGRATPLVEGNAAIAASVAHAPNARCMCTTGSGATVWVGFEPEGQSHTDLLPPPGRGIRGPGRITAIGLSPEGHLAAAGYEDGTVVLWRLRGAA
jgi:hypothetical protein